ASSGRSLTTIARSPVSGNQPVAEPAGFRVDLGAFACHVVPGRLSLWRPPDEREADDTLHILEHGIRPRATDALLTFGGDPVTDRVARCFRAAGAATVFQLHNFQYRDASRLEPYDAIVV